MKNNKSTTFKYNNIDDFKIFDSLENKVIDMPEVIEARIGNKEDIIIFGYMGVKRELIEWYTITEVASK